MMKPEDVAGVTDPAELAKLSRAPAFRRAVAANPSADFQTLMRLAGAHPEIVARNVGLRLSIVTDPTLIDGVSDRVLSSLVRVEGAPEALLNLAEGSKSEPVVFSILMNPCLPSATLERLQNQAASPEEGGGPFSKLLSLAAHAHVNASESGVMLSEVVSSVLADASADSTKLVRVIDSDAPLPAWVWPYLTRGAPSTLVALARRTDLPLDAFAVVADRAVATGSASALICLAERNDLTEAVAHSMFEGLSQREGVWGTHGGATRNRVFASLASNPQTPPAILTELAGVPSLIVAIGLAKNPRASREVLEGLFSRAESKVLEALAMNTAADPNWFAPVEESSDEVMQGLAARPDLHEALFAGLASGGSHPVWKALLLNRATPVWVLEDLLERVLRDVPDQAIRLELAMDLASHPNTNEALLRRLVEAEERVRALPTVVQHPSCPDDVIEQVVREGPYTAQQALLERENLSRDVRATLENAGVEETTMPWASRRSRGRTVASGGGSLFRSRRAAHDELFDFARGQDAPSSFLALLSPLCPQDVLESAARSWLWPQRLAAALNPETPDHVREVLGSDANRWVRKAALARDEVLSSLIESI